MEGKKNKDLQEVLGTDIKSIMKTFYKTIPGNDPGFKEDVIKAIIRVYKDHGYNVISEYGAPSYTEDEMRQELSPLNGEAIEQIIKAKDNYFIQKPSSFYGMDMKDSSGKEAVLLGKDIIGFVSMTLKDSPKSKNAAFKEVINFLDSML